MVASHSKRASETRRVMACLFFVLVLGLVVMLIGLRVFRFSLWISVLALLLMPGFCVLGAFYYQRIWRERIAGPTQLDCGPNPYMRNDVFQGAALLLLAGIMISVAFSYPQAGDDVLRFPAECVALLREVRVLALLGASLFIVFDLFLIVAGFGHLEVYERGMWAYWRLLRWEQIQECRWELPCTLLVRVRITFGICDTVRLHVPLEQRSRMNEILGSLCQFAE